MAVGGYNNPIYGQFTGIHVEKKRNTHCHQRPSFSNRGFSSNSFIVSFVLIWGYLWWCKVNEQFLLVYSNRLISQFFREGRFHFFSSPLPFFRLRLPKSSRIHGYFIKYSRMFHRVFTDISLRIRGYFTFCVFACNISGMSFGIIACSLLLFS